MPTATSSVKISCIRRDIYAVSSGTHVLVVEQARFTLRRAGRCVGHWLKYLVGKLSTTGERIMVCLGNAVRDEIESWIHSSNGNELGFTLRMLEQMLKKLGAAKCLAIALLALREE
jgi:hypothetical protein